MNGTVLTVAAVAYLMSLDSVVSANAVVVEEGSTGTEGFASMLEGVPMVGAEVGVVEYVDKVRPPVDEYGEGTGPQR